MASPRLISEIPLFYGTLRSSITRSLPRSLYSNQAFSRRSSLSGEVPGGYRRSWRYGTNWPFGESLGDTVGRSGLSDRRSNKFRFSPQCPTNDNGKLLIALVRFMSDYFTFITFTVGIAYCYA
ncbi:hypothetical protein IAS59_002146 [Cryptococcus gattii]